MNKTFRSQPDSRFKRVFIKVGNGSSSDAWLGYIVNLNYTGCSKLFYIRDE